PGCEITGMVHTPDLRTLFINVQHPGELPLEHPPRNDPKNPKAVSSWPDGPSGGRPRSATVAIRRADGGVIGGSRKKCRAPDGAAASPAHNEKGSPSKPPMCQRHTYRTASQIRRTDLVICN